MAWVDWSVPSAETQSPHSRVCIFDTRTHQLAVKEHKMDDRKGLAASAFLPFSPHFVVWRTHTKGFKATAFSLPPAGSTTLACHTCEVVAAASIMEQTLATTSGVVAFPVMAEQRVCIWRIGAQPHLTSLPGHVGALACSPCSSQLLCYCSGTGQALFLSAAGAVLASVTLSRVSWSAWGAAGVLVLRSDRPQADLHAVQDSPRLILQHTFELEGMRLWQPVASPSPFGRHFVLLYQSHIKGDADRDGEVFLVLLAAPLAGSPAQVHSLRIDESYSVNNGWLQGPHQLSWLPDCSGVLCGRTRSSPHTLVRFLQL